MEGLLPFASAAALVAVLEVGDKTQLLTMSLASRYAWKPVLLGAALALAACSAIGAAAGAAVGTGLSSWLPFVKVAGGLVFIALGLASLRGKSTEDGERARPAWKSPFAQSLALVFLAEFGDKTQLAVIVLTASSAAPLSVFAGATVGLVAVTGASIWVGVELSRRLRKERVRQLGAALFIVAGALLIGGVALGL